MNGMALDPKLQEPEHYTGINKRLRSQAVQILLDKLDDGTLAEFFDDWKWIFSYSRRYKWIILFYTIVGILGTTLGLVSSVVGKYLIDIIVDRKLEQLWLLAITMLLSTVFGLVFTNLVSRFSTKLTIYVNNDIQSDVFSRILDADWFSLSGYENGDLLNRFNSDVGTVASNAISWLPNLIIALYQFIATFFVILHYDRLMAVIALLSAPILLLVSRVILRKNKEYRQRLLQINSGIMGFEAETFYNLDTIKSFGIMGSYSHRLKKWQSQFKDYSLDYNTFSIKMNIGMTLLNTAVSMVAFAYCLFRLWTGAISYGTMTLFLQQRGQLSGNFNSLVGIIPGMLNSSVSAHRIRELLELPRESHVPLPADAAEAAQAHGFTLKLDAVDFGYRDNTAVLKDVEMVANPGEIIALVGPSGEGKTTMLRLILGLVQPRSGSVTISSKNTAPITVNADTRCCFSYVPQGNTLLSGTVAENLRMVRENASDEELIQALQAACAWDFVQKLEGGIHGKLGERGRGVSEGQAQRLAIARALLRDAPIILLDEATSALDVETERQVLRNIVKQNPNKTCIVTTHRPSVLGLCQRVYRVSDGQVIELDEQAAAKLVQDF